jgi:DNA repair protein RecO (recombination protein O)
MSALTTEGIILRKYFLRETSYILVVFTREFGKIRGVLKGVRDPYPQFAGNFELFTRCKLIFYKKKGTRLDLISRCEAEDFYYPVRRDLKKVSTANYFVELVDAVTIDHDVNERLYDVLSESLNCLSSSQDARNIARIFELKMLEAAGFAPRVGDCAGCGAGFSDPFFFSPKRGGIVCAACSGGGMDGVPISMGAVNFMRKIYEVPFSRVSQINVTKDVAADIARALKGFVAYHLGKEIKSAGFIEELERKGVFEF